MFLALLGGFHNQANAQKKTRTFTVTHIIDASADEVWAVVGEDYGGIAKSHPKIVSSDYINGCEHSGEGAQRVCSFNEKGTRFVKEKQVNYNAEERSFTNQVFEAGRFPVDAEYTFANYRVEEIDANTSRFVFEMTYRTKPAFLGGLMKRSFKNLIEDYTISIQHHVKTGEAITKENFKDIKKKYKRS